MVPVEVDLEQVVESGVGCASRQERAIAELAQDLDLRRVAPGAVDVDHESGAVLERLRGGRVVGERVDHVLGQLDHAQARANVELALDPALGEGRPRVLRMLFREEVAAGDRSARHRGRMMRSGRSVSDDKHSIEVS